MNSLLLKPRGTTPVCRYCSDCGQPFWPRRDDQHFCSPTCRKAHHAIRKQRGLELYDFVMEWRTTRRKGGFSAFCSLVDTWIRENRQRDRDHNAIRKAFEIQARDASQC